MPSGQPTLPWCATVFSPGFGEALLWRSVWYHTKACIHCIKKTLTGSRLISIIDETKLTIDLTRMKSLFSSFNVLAAGMLVLEQPFIFAETFTEGVRVSPETVTLKPGEYVWEPERAPDGPLLIVASVTEQVAYVYRNGIRIARSSVSTGRPGHRTPTGVFTILEKEVHHTSSIYKGAEMPYMERVTWGGIALHAGDLPGYPDSHGCVRLPLEFSKLLFGVTMKGATVIIADEHSAPAETVHPGLFFTQKGEESEPIAAGKFNWDPDKSTSGPVSLIVSSADKTVYVYRNGVEIGRAGIPNAQVVSPLNDRVFSALSGVDAEGHLRWLEVTSAGKEDRARVCFCRPRRAGCRRHS